MWNLKLYIHVRTIASTAYDMSVKKILTTRRIYTGEVHAAQRGSTAPLWLCMMRRALVPVAAKHSQPIASTSPSPQTNKNLLARAPEPSSVRCAWRLICLKLVIAYRPPSFPSLPTTTLPTTTRPYRHVQKETTMPFVQPARRLSLWSFLQILSCNSFDGLSRNSSPPNSRQESRPIQH